MKQKIFEPLRVHQDVRFYMNLSYACSKMPLILGAFLLFKIFNPSGAGTLKNTGFSINTIIIFFAFNG